MYLPHCYYTPGEYFFLYFVFVILMQDISHNLETWWHTTDQRERERRQGCVIVIEEWELCAFYQSWAGSRRWVVHHVSSRFYQGGPFSAPALSAALFSLAHKFRVRTSSVLYVRKCCQRKKRAGPRRTCIYKHVQTAIKRTGWISTFTCTYTRISGLYNQLFVFYCSVFVGSFCVQKKETDRQRCQTQKLYVMKSDQKGFYDLWLLLHVSEMPLGLCGEFFFSVLDLIHCACFNLTVAGALCM